MRTNRSMPSSTVIPVLVYPDVAQAVDWLCCTFGFAEHLRIGSHRSQLTVGDGSIVVAAGLPRPEIDSNKTREGRRSHQGGTNYSVMVRVPNVDRHFERAKSRGAKIVQPPLTTRSASGSTRPRTSGVTRGRFLSPSPMSLRRNGAEPS